MSVTDKADHGSLEHPLQPTLFDELFTDAPTDADGALADATTPLDRALNSTDTAVEDESTDIPTDASEEDSKEDDVVGFLQSTATTDDTDTITTPHTYTKRKVVPATPTDEETSAANPENRRRGLLVKAGAIAGAAVLSVVLGVGLTGGFGGSDTEPQSQATVVSGDIQTEAVNPSSTAVAPEETTIGTTPEEEFSPVNVDNDKTTGIIHTARLIPGEPFTQAQRPNGDLINVPNVRVGSPDNYAVFESGLANFAGWLTTENPDFLQQLTNQTGGEARLVNQFKQDVMKDKAEINSPNFQVSFYDDPEDPAVVSRDPASDGSTRISLTNGRLFMVVTADLNNRNDWQAPSSHIDPKIVSKGAITKVYEITTAQFYITERVTQKEDGTEDRTRIVSDSYLEYELATP